MTFELFLGLRYFSGKRKNAFISIITLISIVGVAVGVTALIVVLSVMTGFDRELRQKVLGATSHIIVSYDGGMEHYQEAMEVIEQHFPEVEGVSPFFAGQVLLRSSHFVLGAALRGIVPEREKKVTDFEKYLIVGSLEEKGMVLGTELAHNLRVSLGDEVTVISPHFIPTPSGQVPYRKRFPVTGLYNSGMYEYDASFCYLPMQATQALFGTGDVASGLEVKVENPFKAEGMAHEMKRFLGPGFEARSWMDLNRNFFNALRHEKIAMFIILILIILVAAFNIASTLIMVVMEKTKDIGILKAIGTPLQSIRVIFVIEGLLVGFIGTLLGVIGGYALTKSLNSIVDFVARYFGLELFPPNIYYFDRIPTQMSPWDVVAIALSAIGICFLATLYPAWQASRLNPVEALRYE